MASVYYSTGPTKFECYELSKKNSKHRVISGNIHTSKLNTTLLKILHVHHHCAVISSLLQRLVTMVATSAM